MVFRVRLGDSPPIIQPWRPKDSGSLTVNKPRILDTLLPICDRLVASPALKEDSA